MLVERITVAHNRYPNQIIYMHREDMSAKDVANGGLRDRSVQINDRLIFILSLAGIAP